MQHSISAKCSSSQHAEGKVAFPSLVSQLLDRALSVQRPIIMTANATVPAMAANKQVMTVDMLAPPAPEVLRLLVLAAAQEGRRCTLQELQHCSNTAEGDVR